MSRSRKWFSKAAPARRWAPLAVQALEDRCLMAASLTASLNDGVLRIEGTGGPDSIVVRRSVQVLQRFGLGNNFTISADGISIDGLSQSFATANVHRIDIL